MLWPQVPEGSNSYIIESNPILLSCVTEELLPVLENIRQTLPGAPYRPFRVSIPATLDIRAGNTVQITDKNGVSFLSLVMSKEQVGQKDTLECTGSPRRDSAAAQHEMTEQEKTLQMQTSAQQYTNDLDRRLDQTGVFDRLTNSGSCQGLFMQDGQLYINASYIKSGIIDAELVQVINLISDKVVSKDQYGGKLEVLGGVLRLYQDDKTLIDMTTEYEGYPLLRMTMLSNGEIATRLEMGAEGIRVVDLTGFVPSVKFAVALDANGEPAITCKDALGQVVEKKLSWKDNTDGTFTLIGK